MQRDNSGDIPAPERVEIGHGKFRRQLTLVEDARSQRRDKTVREGKAPGGRPISDTLTYVDASGVHYEPTGAVTVETEDPEALRRMTGALREIGFEIHRVFGTAVVARPKTLSVAAALRQIEALSGVSGVANIEPEMLTEKAQKAAYAER